MFSKIIISIKTFLKRIILRSLNIQVQDIKIENPSNFLNLEKAKNFKERYREIISDPLNNLINKEDKAGFIDNENNVFLHNGIKVPVNGPNAYCGNFSEILILNRGVHEPLEEFCFQEMINSKHLSEKDIVMIELGSYWAHYSMWMKKKYPLSKVIMVESNYDYMNVGINNFKLNKISDGEFINKKVTKDGLKIDDLVKEKGIKEITVLHSDIQGYEEEMLESSHKTLKDKLIRHLFISTHSNKIHKKCSDILSNYGYFIEVNSEPDFHSTSYDGFILASKNEENKIFKNFIPLGRLEILNSNNKSIKAYIEKMKLH